MRDGSDVVLETSLAVRSCSRCSRLVRSSSRYWR
jgi:hypothetical protein